VVGYDVVAKKVKNKLADLKVAPYYGCMLLRPVKEMDFDDPEQPTVFEDFLGTLGCDIVDFPMKTECCGGFQIVNDEELAIMCSQNVVSSAIKRDADVIVTTCPLCRYNLDKKQEEIAGRVKDFRKIPVIYFTQLLGIALGIDDKHIDFSENYVDPRPVLAEKSLL
jgi:heterodisulfide reductase subunit B